MIQDDLFDMIRRFHDTHRLDKGCNKTFLALIPKCDNPTELGKYRPIGLVNTTYKIIAKILLHRLKPHLSNLISDTQTGFVAGRQILDGIMIANEIIHFIKKKNDSLRKFILIKLDFEKAYDSVNWNFLDSMMDKIGFGQKWRRWIKECTETAEIAVLINGSTTAEFKMGRGLRQGDPLSPALFLIVAEALHLLLSKAEYQGKIKGCPILQNEATLTHLQFADDTLLILQAEESFVANLRGILLVFELCSGLKINYHKIEMFSLHNDISNMQNLAAALGCKIGSLLTKYLGMPLGESSNRIKFWDPVIQRMKEKLPNWKRRNISFGGRITLINSVLSSLPMYYMSLFRIPKTVIKNIDKIRRRFLWGTKEEKRVFAKVNWAKVCRPKRKGGLGITNLEVQNSALLGRWIWRYATEPQALWCKIIKQKYGSHTQNWIPNMEKKKEASSSWRNILLTQEKEEANAITNQESYIWVPGDGCTILYWWDRWQKEKCMRLRFPRLFSLATNKEATLADILSNRTDRLEEWSNLFRRELREWEKTQLLSLISESSNIHLQRNKPDKITWSLSTNGLYSVNKAAKELMKIVSGDEDYEFFKMWKLKIPSKVQAFMWLLSLNRIASKEFLKLRGFALSDQELKCSRCNADLETANHIFLLCQESKEIWSRFKHWWQLDIPWPSEIENLLHLLLNPNIAKSLENRWWSSFVATLWTIWLPRNESNFEKKQCSIDQREFLFKLRSFQWIRASNSLEIKPSDANWWFNPRTSHQNRSAPQIGIEEKIIILEIFFNHGSQEQSGRKLGIGAILKDEKGELLALIDGNMEYADRLSGEIEASLAICSKFNTWSNFIKLPVRIHTAANALMLGARVAELRSAPHISLFRKLDNLLAMFESIQFIHQQPDALKSAQTLALIGSKKPPGINLFWVNTLL